LLRKIGILTLLFAFLYCTVTFAHSGRTDSSGGHNCSDKSRAKGLCSGYHNHNGGGTSTGGTAVINNDKDCTDFSSYDEAVNYWNAKGYSATYDPENLDGWGNNVVDDGIPCEPPSGYDKTLINNSPEQIQHEQKERDFANGEKAAYPVGQQDGYNEVANSSGSVTGAEAYRAGYVTGYNKGYEEGKMKISAEKINAANEGYALGQKQDIIAIPASYTANVILKKAFEDGFNKAISEKVAAKKKEIMDKGYADGKNDVHSPPTDLDEIYVTSYQEGYEIAQKELKEQYVKQGYDAALTMVKFQAPSISNDKFINWYKEGFDSNIEVDKIMEDAISLGQSGEPLKIPANYKKGEVLFKHYYKVGYKEYEEQQNDNQKAAGFGVGGLALTWLGRRFYVVKKMIG
jgi:hypothetical protein